MTCALYSKSCNSVIHYQKICSKHKLYGPFLETFMVHVCSLTSPFIVTVWKREDRIFHNPIKNIQNVKDV